MDPAWCALLTLWGPTEHAGIDPFDKLKPLDRTGEHQHGERMTVE